MAKKLKKALFVLLIIKMIKQSLRRTLESGGEWILEKKLTNDKLITDDKSLCNQNGQTERI